MPGRGPVSPNDAFDEPELRHWREADGQWRHEGARRGEGTIVRSTVCTCAGTPSLYNAGRDFLRFRVNMAAIEPFETATFAFFFDVDGTLIDIAATPQSVHVPPSLPRTLRQLCHLTRGATALVSGRTLSDLDRFFGPIGVALVGGHGAEVRLGGPGSIKEQRAPALPDWIGQRCREIAAADDRILVEDKGYSIAIHYRLAPEREQSIRNSAAAIVADAAGDELKVLQGKEIVEIKRAGIDKGRGLRTLMAHTPFAGRRPIFVGDDITDEDAFAALPEFDGIGLSVGRTMEGATRRFESPAEVRDWIEQICRSGAAVR